QVVLLLGDGAAGFSLMDADTLVRHRLPVVMICGNNGAWGLEKHPMQALYGYDVAADLQPRCRYDEVVRALGRAREIVTAPALPLRGPLPGALPPRPRGPLPPPAPRHRPPGRVPPGPARGPPRDTVPAGGRPPGRERPRGRPGPAPPCPRPPPRPHRPRPP